MQQPHFLALALLGGLALGTLGVSARSGQSLTSRPFPGTYRDVQARPVNAHWPPRPENIVNIDANYPTIPIGGEFVAYDVPLDQWLVVTDFTAGAYIPQPFEILERLGGFDTVKLGRTLSNHSGQDVRRSYDGGPVGLAFRPGSQVVLRNTAAPAEPIVPTFHACGYLVDG